MRYAMVVVCRRDGNWYDMDFSMPLSCHEDDDDAWFLTTIEVTDDDNAYAFDAATGKIY